MKTGCVEVEQWLLNAMGPEISMYKSGKIPEQINDHLLTCISCKNLIKTRMQIDSDLDQLGPTPQAERRIAASVLLRVRQGQARSNPEVSVLEKIVSLLSPKTLALGSCFLVVMIVFSLFRFSSPLSRSNMSVSGRLAFIKRDRNSIPLSTKSEPTFVKDRLELDGGLMEIAFQPDRRIVVTGRGSSVIEEGGLKITSGDLRLEFSPTTIGYKVRVSNVELTILGTIIQTSVSPAESLISVEKGLVSWIGPTQGKGKLAAGQRLRILGNNVSVVPLGQISRPKVVPAMIPGGETPGEPPPAALEPFLPPNDN